jgi:hypothetical protein
MAGAAKLFAEFALCLAEQLLAREFDALDGCIDVV